MMWTTHAVSQSLSAAVDAAILASFTFAQALTWVIITLSNLADPKRVSPIRVPVQLSERRTLRRKVSLRQEVRRGVRRSHLH
jgi:hypothetical protein